MKVPVYNFDAMSVKAHVEQKRFGTYILGDSADGYFFPKYVGRSDTCLRRRLLTHNHFGDYPYYIFVYEESPKLAFFDECKWWHDCQISGIELDNKIHPDSPDGENLSCPYCGFKIESMFGKKPKRQ